MRQRRGSRSAPPTRPRAAGVDPAVVKSSYIFPTAADLAKVHLFRTLTATEEKDFVGAFQQVLGA